MKMSFSFRPRLVTAILTVSAGIGLIGVTAVPGTPTSAAADIGAAANLVVNPDFENGLQGWMPTPAANARLALTQGRNGVSAARLSSASAPSTVVLNDTKNTVASTVAGATYSASAWVRVGERNTYVVLRLSEYTRSNTLAGQGQAAVTHQPGGWAQITVDYTAKTDGATIDLNVLSYKLVATNYVDIDDVSFIDVTPAPEPSWTLAWSDEFNGAAVDTTNWTVLNNSTYGTGNNELACLMSRSQNVEVSAGTLKLTALREATPITCEGGATRSYTSAHLHGKNKLSFTYGRFEIRAKVPMTPGVSKGLWPAFWMRPAVGGLGEIDIMEQVGTSPTELAQANRVSQTLWYDYIGTYPKQALAYKSTTVDLSAGFHTYAVEWEEGSIRWYVDDILTFERLASDVPWITGTFDQAFYLRLNLAVGGNWPGTPTADTVFPATYEVDYVRVYQR
jgi:beta-glucanase (GH16 family)